MRRIMLLAWLGLTAAAGAQDKASDGFKPLFNGKDLQGWKTHPDDKAKWEVVDGSIVGSGPAGHLFTDRNDFVDFVLRFEVMINDKGNSGQFFRTQFSKAFPKGYEAQINATHTDKIRTGSLYPSFNPKLTADQKAKILVYDAPHKPNEWFVQEVTMVGNKITIRVNGKVTVDFVDDNSTHKKGHIAIQQHDPGSTVKVRRVEIKELRDGPR